MTKPTILLLIVLFMMEGCENIYEKANNDCADWITTASKPIVVTCQDRVYGKEYHTYFLIDANGKAYIAHAINASLPDTIK